MTSTKKIISRGIPHRSSSLGRISFNHTSSSLLPKPLNYSQLLSYTQRRRNHGGAGGASPPENLTKGAGTFYYTAVQCSTARSVDLRVRASSRRVCARATLRVPAQHAWEGSCK